MATGRREESERRAKREGQSLREEARHEFKAPRPKSKNTERRRTPEVFLCPDGRDEEGEHFRENRERPKLPD